MVDFLKQVTEGFQILLRVFAPYLARELMNEYKDDWWSIGVLEALYDNQRYGLPEKGEWDDLVNSLDIQRCLIVFEQRWNQVFRRKMAKDYRTWAHELRSTRNKWAHANNTDIPEEDIWRALDTMARFCDEIDPESAGRIRSLYRELRYGSSEGSTAAPSITTTSMPRTVPVHGQSVRLGSLPSWREVIHPHPDVAQGVYRQAEFAADLAQVARGEGSYEYLDPIEFFKRTYVTEGMMGLLVQSVRRVSEQGGEPVIQLKTAFGGGKTHSMLALYHLMRRTNSTELMGLESIQEVLRRSGITRLPNTHVAVIVGTALDPSRSKRPPYMPGITVNTLWGEIAAQLSRSAGRPELYDIIKEADKKSVSPGSETLKRLFDACGPCVILMDELVAYAKKLLGPTSLPAGTFDNFIAFIQEISEAARASKNSLVVASIPESEHEIGGEAGQRALETIEHTFGRMEAIWRPISSHEGFEVVRRRLFLECRNEEARNRVCASYSQLYRDHPGEFPMLARERDYERRLQACYPIHPELFDRLYEDWATLERFQRTRGVLRFMAAVIHELWVNEDHNPLIMPGSLPLSNTSVRDELTRQLDEGWNAIIDAEVDGARSIPQREEGSTPRFGLIAASRRVARTIFLGSAPSVREQRIRGIEASRIHLGVAQPEESIAVYNDALSKLQNSLTYLYSNSANDRFWYDTRPTLRKIVSDRASQISVEEQNYEIERRLRSTRRSEPFAAVHSCPASSFDIPDDMNVRLVILKPTDRYHATVPDSPARVKVDEFIRSRGQGSRIYRNMLVFVAPDMESVPALEEETRQYLAWRSIDEDRRALNLDVQQVDEVEKSIRRSNQVVDARIQEAYCLLLTPYINVTESHNEILWESQRINGGLDSIVVRAANRVLHDETVIQIWAPRLLKKELDDYLWCDSDHIQIRQLWNLLCQYCYLPRLANQEVLLGCIKAGLRDDQHFAFAEDIQNGDYIGLAIAPSSYDLNMDHYLVKLSVAERVLQERAATTVLPVTSTESNTADTSRRSTRVSYPTTPSQPSQLEMGEPKKKRFYMSAPLNRLRISDETYKIAQEILNLLTDDENTQLTIRLEVNAHNNEGFSRGTIRAVSENCQTLNYSEFGFEEE